MPPEDPSPESAEPGRFARLRPWLVIIAVAALAHLWCLGSVFYMDDMNQIRDNEALRDGDVGSGLRLVWTRLGYLVQYRLFGMSPVGFHAVNWLLHTAAACALFGFAREFLKGPAAAGTAWFAALLFAVHPLCSEIPNYARTQDLAWVTLFSLLACRAMVRFLQGGRPWLAGVVLLGVAGASLSKGPGLFHALMMVGMVALVSLTREHWGNYRRWGPWVAGIFVAGIALTWALGWMPRWIAYVENNWSGPRFISHAYTNARVFWEFAWRAVVPVKLCSDHQIAETLVKPGDGWFGIADKRAMFAAAVMLALTAGSLFLTWLKPTRLFGVCLFLFVATMLFRTAFLVVEFMPEYRIYPGMPWFCLGAAILLTAVWKRIPGGGSPRLVAAIVLIPCIVLSARRSFVWHSLDTLCADVLRQYPAHGRPVWELHDRDLHEGSWEAIVARQETEWPGVFRKFLEANKRLAPARELPSGQFALAAVACKARYAIALTHARGPAAGLTEIGRLEQWMKALQITEDRHRVHWGYYHHARATILEELGAYDDVLESMRFEGVFKITPADIERVERKRSEGR